ncbi:MAG: 1,4-dihydroxy-6-naphthoate synthase [Bacteroidetes bacterium]|nr:1,4-dihydroxy-6-naphthoate synthase [Bacteroidota bacterium]MBS1975230.1 1,4-dihydroxy-6-naphthoate synthase [Bacteroidota bacterium]
MKLTLGFSPCPNDTFIFDALVNKKIDTGNFEFDVLMEDVQTLNQWALQGKLDISKISYGVFPRVQNDYDLLGSGGALGKGVGPLLIAKKQIALEKINECSIGIPGRDTTANMLFSLAFPSALKKEFLIFSGIEEAVLNGKVDAGVIIHENRFTYQDKGLLRLMDLGEFWEQETGCPVPLGGIVIKKKFEKKIQQQINLFIRKSIEYSWASYPSISVYIRKYAQEMSEHVMRQHIDLYVNNYSFCLGEDGKNAISTLLDIYAKINSSQPANSFSVID